MAFSTNIRLATPSDAAFGRAAAAAAGLLWSNETMRTYYDDPDIVIGIGEIRWPEQGIPVDTPCGLIMARKRSATEIEVLLLAIDPAVLPDVPVNVTRRRTIIDRVLRRALEIAVGRGFTTGYAKVAKSATKMTAYVESITGVTIIDDPETALRNRYSMNLTAAITFLQTRSG